MPSLHLDAGDAELAEMLQFLSGWLTAYRLGGVRTADDARKLKQRLQESVVLARG
jgi:hypothetical protein